jgi:DNA polymerase-3 subunit delta'
VEDIKNNLFSTVQYEKIAHAQLFMGHLGSANLALALAYATLLNCDDPQNGDSCGRCASCQKNLKYIHPDVHFAFPVSGIANIPAKDAVSDRFIDPWRNFLHANPYGGPYEWSQEYGGENKQLNISRAESRNIIKALSLKSFEGKYKVMIIWLPEFFHPSSANALLKILEEPPERTIFLLVTNDHEQLLSTIISRTQIINIRAFHDQEISAYLQQYHSLPESKARQLAHIASGNLNEAIRLVNEAEHDTHKMFTEWMRWCWSREYTKLVKLAEDFGKMNKISQKGIFQYGLNLMRESLVVNYQKEQSGRLAGEEKKFVDNFAKVLDMGVIEVIYNALNQAYYHLQRNANTKILFMDTSILISQAFLQRQLKKNT